jgi:hypothetical protein
VKRYRTGFDRASVEVHGVFGPTTDQQVRNTSRNWDYPRKSEAVEQGKG